MKARSPASSSGSPMPVVSTSSPPRSREAMSGTSEECTQRTVRSRCSSPATTRGDPPRTGARLSTWRTLGKTLLTDLPADFPEGDGRGGRDIERVDAPVHGDGDAGVAGPQRVPGQPGALGAEQ